MPRPKMEYISKDVEKLEKQIKDIYGKKRGAAMIESARQDAEYKVDKERLTQMEFTKIYLEILRAKL